MPVVPIDDVFADVERRQGLDARTASMLAREEGAEMSKQDPDWPFPCGQCPRAFASRQGLGIHMGRAHRRTAPAAPPSSGASPTAPPFAPPDPPRRPRDEHPPALSARAELELMQRIIEDWHTLPPASRAWVRAQLLGDEA